jgi:hypothetical protein
MKLSTHFNQNSVGIGDLARGLIYLGHHTDGKRGSTTQLVEGIATRMSMEIVSIFGEKTSHLGKNGHIHKIYLQHT